MTDERDAEQPETPEVVLVVDADVLVRVAVAAYLRECGYKVIEAGGAEEAMPVLQQPEINVDVVLSEVALGDGLDGFSLARWIRSNRAQTDVILVATPARAAEAASDLCEQGPLLAKPYDHQLLASRIRQLRASRKKNSMRPGEIE